jgi:hypothetical protein
MPSLPVLSIVVAILVGGLALVVGGLVGLVQWLRIRTRGVASGPVDLRGRCRPLEESSLTAPVTGEPALCYRWRLEREAGRVTRPVWQTLESGDERTAFDLVTDDDTVRVTPTGADLDLETDEELLLETREDLPDSIENCLEEVPEFGDEERYRLVEERLEGGDRVSLTGRLSKSSGTSTVAGPRSRSLVARLFAVPFVVADAGRDGGAGRLRDRAIAGFVLGLPPTLLAIVLLFPPEIGG